MQTPLGWTVTVMITTGALGPFLQYTNHPKSNEDVGGCTAISRSEDAA